jgi:hypothetical protein
MSDEKVFSIDEANVALAGLRERLPRIRDARRLLLESAEKIEGSAPANGGGPSGKEYWESMRALRFEIEQIAEEGIILRDPETGLVDFPAEIDGREVFLCWRLGEAEVGFWHDTQSGFSSRKPLDSR